MTDLNKISPPEGELGRKVDKLTEIVLRMVERQKEFDIEIAIMKEKLNAT